MCTTTFLSAFVTAALALGALSQANAIPTLRITTSDGGFAEVADGSVGDSNPPGVIVFSGFLPGWAFNVSSGFSKPAIGSADQPMLDLSSVNLSSAGEGSIDIWLSDTDFTAIPTQAAVLAAIGGTTAGTVSYKTYFDSSNALFGQGAELTSMGPFASTAFSSTAGAALTSAGLYSLTMLVSIHHDGLRPYQISSFDASMAVPEPGTLFLFGAGLMAVALRFGRRRSMAVAL